MEVKKLKFESSWDDGHMLDLYLASLLKTYELPATFFIPSNCQLEPEHIRRLVTLGFQIGGHTVNHPQDMKELMADELKIEIEDNKAWLENMLQKPITEFCYPRGRFNDEVKEAVKNAGFKTARTTKVLVTEDIYSDYEKATTIHVYNRSEYMGREWLEVAKKYAEWAHKSGGIFHLWGHSWEIERDENWRRLDELFEYLTSNFEIEKV